MLSDSDFEVVLPHLFDLWDAEGPTFGNQMVPYEGSRGSEGAKNLPFKWIQKGKALFHLHPPTNRAHHARIFN